MKKLLAILFAVALLLSQVGCVSSEREAHWRIQAYLESKYGGTFQVSEVTYIAPSPEEPFGVGYYTGTAVHAETGVSFDVTCQVVGTGDVCDFDAKAVYGEIFEQKLRSTFAQYPAFALEDLALNWRPSPDDWDPYTPFEEFIVQPNILSVEAVLTVPEEGLVDQAEALLGLCQELDAYNSTMPFDITLRIDGTQAKVAIPSQHQLDIDLIRADLERLAAMSPTE